MNKWDWESLNEDLEGATQDNGPFESIRSVSRFLKIPYGTVYDAFGRGDLDPNFVSYADDSELPSPDQRPSVQMDRNEAVIKYNAAEPMSEDEVLALARIDTNEWRVASSRINLWQMGRKAKEVDLSWYEGKADGWVKDSGEINKTYLYQIELKLERVKRIAVEPVIQPIVFQGSVIPNRPPLDFPDADQSILFIADPQFGFTRINGRLEPFHVRQFLADLIAIAEDETPDQVVWSGDVLDFADFSRYDSEPELLFNVQLASIELAYVLDRFTGLTRHQVILEGNHDVRLAKAMAKNMASAYELKPVHDLGGDPLMSVPRLLGLNKLGVQWIPGYPDNQYRVGQVLFEHGSTARAGSAKTTAYLARDAVISKFFGHIHRHELAQKYVHDLRRDIWVGSPGCACDRRLTPGSKSDNNWQLGAFLIHLHIDGSVNNVEHIAGNIYGRTYFRGRQVVGGSYLENLKERIPSRWGEML